MSNLSKSLIIGILSFGASLSAIAEDMNCPAGLPLAEINFIENDVKFLVVDAIPIEKFESSKLWEQMIGDIKVTAKLDLQESKTKKRVLLKDREIYAIRMDEYNYTSEYEASIQFDDPAINQIQITHTSTTGSSVYTATVGSIERAFNGALRITCEPATVDPTIR